jgi:hypothetical protein
VASGNDRTMSESTTEDPLGWVQEVL